jgi:hydroxylysine kinase
MLIHAPRFDAAAAARIARDLYGVTGDVRALTSERDQNFLLEAKGGERLVLKIANALEDPAMLDAQQRAMTHLGATLDLVPRVIPTLDGSTLRAVADNGRQHQVWAVSHRPGIPLGLERRRSPALLEHLGARIGDLTLAFRGFDHPALHREFYWDLARGRDLIARYRPLIDDAALGACIDAIMDRFDREAVPLLARLPTSTIHGDLNDFNVLVEGDRVTGFVDFGDMVYGYTLGDLAIAPTP